jgi:hypothetical protein
MKTIFALSLLFVSSLSLAQSSYNLAEYPVRPLPKLTPGKLCDQPTAYRYPEQIAYCERDVSVEQKDEVFEAYRRAGYRLNQQERSSYKVDHYIPLCAGGSNSNLNLWPQHLNIYQITDSIEKLGCDKMAQGRLSQARFIQLIRIVKNDLSKAQAVQQELSRY